MNTRRRGGLGRGLDALLGVARDKNNDGKNKSGASGGGGDGLREVPLSRLRPGKGQPRRRFDEGELRALADSIREHGFLQPIVARPVKGGMWEIVAGERRWRAAKLAGKKTAPIIERETTEQEAAALALVENLQRADLNPLEQAQGLSQLIEAGSLTHAQAGAAVGMSRAAVTNLLRLLELSSGARKLVENGELEMAHARALLALPLDVQDQAARAVVRGGMSARATEEFVRGILNKSGAKRKAKGKNKTAAQKDADTARLEQELSASLSAQVEIRHQPSGRGSLTVRYGSLTTLDGIIARLRKKPR